VSVSDELSIWVIRVEVEFAAPGRSVCCVTKSYQSTMLWRYREK